MDIIWKGIIDFEKYEVSSLGGVRRNRRELKPYRNKDGYLTVKLYKNSQWKNFLVHRLVALAFYENPMNLPTVNHKNGVKDDNRVENLEWADKKQQVAHAMEIGIFPEVRTVTYIVATAIGDGTTFICKGQSVLAKALNIPQPHISACCLGKEYATCGWRFKKLTEG